MSAARFQAERALVSVKKNALIRDERKFRTQDRFSLLLNSLGAGGEGAN
jgi:hypothetical protein